MISRVKNVIMTFIHRPKVYSANVPPSHQPNSLRIPEEVKLPAADPRLALLTPSKPSDPCIDFSTHFKASIAAYHAEHYKKARAEINKAIWLAPKNSTAYLQRAEINYFDKRYQDANDDLWRCVYCDDGRDEKTIWSIGVLSDLTRQKLEERGMSIRPRC
jgi:tetratricopeptide (TPR) repeat protein